MSRPAWGIVLVVGLLVAGCAGSDGETSSSVPDTGVDSGIESDGDVFSEGETQTSVALDPDDSDAAEDGQGASANSVVDSETDAQNEQAGGSGGSVVDTDDDSATDAEADTDEAAPAPDESGPADPEPPDAVPDPEQPDAVPDNEPPTPDNEPSTDPDDIDSEAIDDIISVDEVDDVAFCQSYARVVESFLAVSFGAALGQADVADPDALVSLAETYEVIVYPGLAGDVETIRNEDVDGAAEFFGPLFERIDAASGLLRDAGLSNDEIDELTTDARPSDLDTIDLDTIDPRVTDAAVSMGTEFGLFFEVADNLVTPPADEEAFEARLTELCPLLAGSLRDV